MEQEIQNYEAAHRPFFSLRKILALSVLGAATYAYNETDFFKLSPSGAETFHELADNFSMKTGVGLGQVVGSGATDQTLRGTTNKNAILYEGGTFNGELLGVTTISASALQSGQSYYFPDAAKIKGDLKNVHILAQGRIIIEGNCTDCTLSVENVPFYGHSEAGSPIGLGPGVAVATNFQANDGLVYPGQPSLVVTGIATNSVLWADNSGEIQVGENHGSSLRTTGQTYIGKALQLDKSSTGRDIFNITIDAGDKPVILTDPSSVVTKGSDGSTTITTSGQNGISVKTIIRMTP